MGFIRKHNHTSFDGKVVDETKNTVVIEAGGKKKRIAKASHIFCFRIGAKEARIDGDILQKRPEERIKTKLMRRW